MILSAVVEEDRDTDRKRSSYTSRKEFKIFLAVFLIVVAGVLLYVRLVALPQTWTTTSRGNLRAIYGAVQLYAAQNDDGLPPAYAVAGNGGILVDSKGRPVTWANQISTALNDTDDLNNPANKIEWDTVIGVRARTGDQRVENTQLSYGIVSWATFPPLRTYEIGDSHVLIAETISGGRANSFNPLPLQAGVRDGFLIGYDNSNFRPDDESRFLTRLALIGESRTDNPTKLTGIHPGGSSLAILASGNLARFRGEHAELSGGTLGIRWRP